MLTPGEKPPERVSAYEGAEHPAYSELGRGESFDQWGSCVVTGKHGEREWRPYYSDADLARHLFTDPILEQTGGVHGKEMVVADFGGGDGTLLEQVRGQLSEAGVEKITPILIDVERKGKIAQATESYPELQPVQGDLLEIPLQTGSVDVGISRHAIQYLPRPYDSHNTAPEYKRFREQVIARNPERKPEHAYDQSDFLKELYRVMKPGGTVTLVWPGAFKYGTEIERRKADAVSYFWNSVTGMRISGEGKRIVVGDDISQERWFTAGEELARFAQKAGFEVETAEECSDIEFRITPQSISDRFDPQSSWSEGRKKLIQSCFDRAGTDGLTRDLDIVDWNGEKAVRIPISRLVLKKR